MPIFSEGDMTAIGLSVKVAVVSTLLLLPMATALSWWLARKSFRGKSLVEGLLHVPMVAPPVVIGFFLLIVFGRQGLIGGPLCSLFGIRISFTFAAAVIAAVTVSLPLSIRAIKAAFELVDPAYERIAESLGASPLRVFFTVSLPIALPGVAAGAILAFARSLGEFGATITFAGNIDGETRTVPTAIFTKMQVPGSMDGVIVLAAVCIAVSVLAVAASELFLKRHRCMS